MATGVMNPSRMSSSSPIASTSASAPSPSVVESESAWLADMSRAIKERFSVMADEAKQELNALVAKHKLDPVELEKINREYSLRMATLMKMLREEAEIQIEVTRQQRRWASGEAVDESWKEVMVKEQQAILDAIKRESEGEGGKREGDSDASDRERARSGSTLSMSQDNTTRARSGSTTSQHATWKPPPSALDDTPRTNASTGPSSPLRNTSHDRDRADPPPHPVSRPGGLSSTRVDTRSPTSPNPAPSPSTSNNFPDGQSHVRPPPPARNPSFERWTPSPIVDEPESSDELQPPSSFRQSGSLSRSGSVRVPPKIPEVWMPSMPPDERIAPTETSRTFATANPDLLGQRRGSSSSTSANVDSVGVSAGSSSGVSSTASKPLPNRPDSYLPNRTDGNSYGNYEKERAAVREAEQPWNNLEEGRRRMQPGARVGGSSPLAAEFQVSSSSTMPSIPIRQPQDGQPYPQRYVSTDDVSSSSTRNSSSYDEYTKRYTQPSSPPIAIPIPSPPHSQARRPPQMPMGYSPGYSPSPTSMSRAQAVQTPEDEMSSGSPYERWQPGSSSASKGPGVRTQPSVQDLRRQQSRERPLRPRPSVQSFGPGDEVNGTFGRRRGLIDEDEELDMLEKDRRVWERRDSVNSLEDLEAQARRREAEAIRKEEEAKKKEAEAKKKEEEAKRKEEEARLKEEEVRKREEAVKRREEELERREAESRRKEAEARRLEQEAKRREEDARRKEEEAQRKEAEAVRKQEEARRKEDETRRKEEEARQKEEEKQQQEFRKREEEIRRKRQDSAGSSSSSPASNAGFHHPSSASHPSDPRFAGIPGDRSSTTSTSSKNSTAGSSRSSPSYTSSSSHTSWTSSGTAPSSTSSRTSTTSNGGAKPSASVPPRPSPSSSMPAPGTTPPYSQSEWERRQQEHAQKQQEAFLKDQERREREKQAKAAQGVSKAEIVRLWEENEQRYQKLSEFSKLYWSSFPWPQLKRPTEPEEITTNAIGAFVLSTHHSTDKAPRDRLKEQLLRWHPDRFDGKWMPKVVPNEREKVKSGADVVVRGLNELMARESSASNLFA